jgi:Bacterial extracellular solute-binding protein, family 7
MKRRRFLASTSAVAAAAATAFPTPAIAQGARELKLVTSWPKGLPGLGTGAERIARSITELSGGRLQVTVFAAGELVSAFESFDAVGAGVADMYHSAEYYWEDKSPAFSFFCSVPFGLTASEMNAWIYWGGGQELWDALGAEFNLKPLLVGNTGVQMGGWFAKEVTGIESYKGLRYRMPGLGGRCCAGSAPSWSISPAGRSSPPCSRARSMPANGSARGTTWRSACTRQRDTTTIPASTKPGTAFALGVNKTLWDELEKGEFALAVVGDELAAACGVRGPHSPARGRGGA